MPSERETLRRLLPRALDTSRALMQLTGALYECVRGADFDREEAIIFAKHVWARVPWGSVPNRVRIKLLRSAESNLIPTLRAIVAGLATVPEDQAPVDLTPLADPIAEQAQAWAASRVPEPMPEAEADATDEDTPEPPTEEPTEEPPTMETAA